MEKTFKIKEFNEFITCSICTGYLINASTVTECLHTFCHSCIVKHLEQYTHCPRCEKTIHHSHPMNYLRLDRTMQDVVYKLVPGLQKREGKRVEKFARKSAPNSKRKVEISQNSVPSKVTARGTIKEENNYHRHDEQVAICLECQRIPENKKSIKPLRKKYLRLSSQATVQILRKYLAKKLNLKSHTDIDIFCNEELLGKDHTLKFITLTRWKFKKGPLILQYRSSLHLF
ncbi:polycomb group RING finger protein 3-like isoform X2 [Xenia sp. Carnegie-2017]|nr:polycomb group RING finger protein 3-like isoform X2 [Xenia sp. Carnegie-2017]XP_046851443.1 polycomb group RING finger protein 3-like isoform X2 [Xenia sp. Carnegie-2017]XP_046851444.1 polycomb group RING finger protein 3-like isoform X2 [Xenia sp. Carnegie-2017]XP_046851445.1 polycomb group RING finger protein 3-like isoform X2 [Xenia sp. Carnegie-2017]